MTDVELKVIWKRQAPKIRQDAQAFWDRLKILPEGVTAKERLMEITVVAYQGDTLVGVSTARLQRVQWLRTRLAMFRCSVAPEFQRTNLATELGGKTREVLEEWSKKNPGERVMGMGAVIQGPNLAAKGREPIWPVTGLTLAGFTKNGFQFRVSWFKHGVANIGVLEKNKQAALTKN